jgi:glycosyltransferase involved in cell wall biosynthesis
MRKIVWLPSWFPTRLDPLAGDFIERHAVSASLYCNIYVIHLIKEDRGKMTASFLTESRIFNENCRAEILYYRSRFKMIKWLEVLDSNLKFIVYSLRSFRSYLKAEGRPDCVHVHIALKAGLVAMVIKKIYKIPYVVSEQWTGLVPESRPNLNEKSFLFRWLWKRVMKNASAWSAVSHYLGSSIQKRFSLSDYMVIPNIVNTEIFYPGSGTQEDFHFIHISVLNYQKNPEQLFEAISILKSRTVKPFKVFIFGNPGSRLQELAFQLNIQDLLEFKAACPQPDLAGYMRQSRALILYSRFETFGCVIIEANACGLPVIVSDIPVLHENVMEGVTGTLVPLDDPRALAEKMEWMMQNHADFDSHRIVHQTREKYSYAVAGKLFDDLYSRVISGSGNRG